MSEYEDMLERRKAQVRELEDDVFFGFLALNDDAKHRVAARLDKHYGGLRHSELTRWALKPRVGTGEPQG